MIDFTHVGDFSWRYFYYNHYLKFFHNHLYYRKMHVVNRENIPAKGKPVLIIYNHQNGLSDPLNILYMFDDFRQPVFIARGDIFKKDRVARFVIISSTLLLGLPIILKAILGLFIIK